MTITINVAAISDEAIAAKAVHRTHAASPQAWRMNVTENASSLAIGPASTALAQ